MFGPDHCSYEGLNGDEDCGEAYLYDTYDQIIDTNRGDQDMDVFDEMGPEEIGLAFALAEELYGDECQSYELEKEFDQELDRAFEVDEDTDRDNWEKAMKISSLQSRHGSRKRLRPFEQYIDDICKGRRPLFED
jgi:hypothetical protein